ncbi:type II toxin-antitoxin system HigB family toxin [Microcoleus asticus]|uniref:mRNA interferase HigB n=1 Tax=Microcoleus asticus IPMA8 TaxID=2563858 RepID=A0ABX2CZM7_9CYAN|nr:type II toxin-antitoxin system HigB family toxin [Microcoleus asticus]NQE35779.1 mRNA interferase HigB [Microcoleus asticus IPMA8]
MHVISRKKLRDYCQNHADSCEALDDWYKIASQANWIKLIEVQTIYPQAEAVGNFTIFNIKGNNYRLIVSLNYQKQIVYIKYILTNAEYDKENWKNDPYF